MLPMLPMLPIIFVVNNARRGVGNRGLKDTLVSIGKIIGRSEECWRHTLIHYLFGSSGINLLQD